MMRLLKQFKPDERNSNIEAVMLKLRKMLMSRERTNFKDFVFATEYERILWTNVTYEYDERTPIFAINVTAILYDYFSKEMVRYANLNEKLMMKVASIHGTSTIGSDGFFKIEQNDGSFTSTYMKQFEKDSGVGVKKSAFAGKKREIKMNTIIDKIKKERVSNG